MPPKPRVALPPASRSDLRLDLNLFRVLDAIHSHGGISQAARALHLSQPAISHALRRLRELFDDPLFVRQGNQMLPTERTRRVIAQVQSHVRGLGAVLNQGRSFEPAELEMSFEIGVRDVLESITFPRLMQHLAQLAPGVSLSSRRVVRQQMEAELTAGRLDLAIERLTRTGPRIRSLKLADESMVVLTAKGEGRKRAMTLKQYLAARHVQVSLGPEASEALDRFLADQGMERRVALRCQHYFAAAQVVAETGWMLTMPRTYARNLAQVLPVSVHELPFQLPPIPMMMYWHADREDDPAHRWLRGLLASGAVQVMNGMNRRRSSNII